VKDRIMRMIGNAHVDPVWLWRCEEGCHEVMASFRSALDRMNEEPDFIFTASSAAFFAWVEQISPAMFEEIKQRVEEGRWEIVGGWWVEPDCNIPHGESFCRHSLYGQRYFKEKFGRIARVGYNPDSFGHAGSLPQILKKSGLDYYVFLRPSRQEKGLPGLTFWWESDDGSRVLAYRIPYEYGTKPEDIDKHVRRCAAELRAPHREIMVFYGVGNHGGGPTKRNIASIHRLNDDADLPRLVFSRTDEYFAAVEAQGLPLPVVHDELQHHAVGSYAAHSGIKAWNRRAERMLMTAEKFCSLASALTGAPYPADELRRAWRQVLFNQFHDILAGTSVETAYEDARDMLGEATAIAARTLNTATQSLAWNIVVPRIEGTNPLVVFNPHAWQSRTIVDMEYGILPEDHVLVDDQDARIPFQRGQSEAAVRRRDRLQFIADLPPLGYRVYRVVPEHLAGPAAREPDPTGSEDPSGLGAGENWLENEFYRLEFDGETGYLTSLYDKRAQVEALAGPAAVPDVLDDPSDTWSHNILRYDKVVDKFVATSMAVAANGPVKAVLRVVSECGRSKMIQDFTLYAGLDHIDVFCVVDWHEQRKALKLRFAINVHFQAATSQIPYGHITRAVTGDEEPGGAWIDLSGASRVTDEPYGVSILNDSKHSYDVTLRTAGLTVLRSPIYAHHDPMVPDPARIYSHTDQGIQRFRYTLLPHLGSWQEAGTVHRAAEINHGPVALAGEHGTGGIPPPEGRVPAGRAGERHRAGAQAGRGRRWAGRPAIRIVGTGRARPHLAAAPPPSVGGGLCAGRDQDVPAAPRRRAARARGEYPGVAAGMRFFTVQKLERLLGEVEAAVYRQSVTLKQWKAIEHDIPGAEAVDFDECGWRDFTLGDAWGGYDIVAWFRARVTIPEEWEVHNRRRKLALRFLVGPREEGNSTAETLLYVSGEPLQAIDRWHEEAWLPPETYASGSVLLALRAWSGVLQVPPVRHFRRAELVLIDEPAERLAYLTRTLLQAVYELPDSDLRRNMILEALHQVYLGISFNLPRNDRFYESIAAASRTLSAELEMWRGTRELKPQITAIGQAHIDMAWLWRLRHPRESRPNLLDRAAPDAAVSRVPLYALLAAAV
jgi:alpha-mannosidase